jgi:hypothetical protein
METCQGCEIEFETEQPNGANFCLDCEWSIYWHTSLDDLGVPCIRCNLTFPWDGALEDIPRIRLGLEPAFCPQCLIMTMGDGPI